MKQGSGVWRVGAWRHLALPHHAGHAGHAAHAHHAALALHHLHHLLLHLRPLVLHVLLILKKLHMF